MNDLCWQERRPIHCSGGAYCSVAQQSRCRITTKHIIIGSFHAAHLLSGALHVPCQPPALHRAGAVGGGLQEAHQLFGPPRQAQERYRCQSRFVDCLLLVEDCLPWQVGRLARLSLERRLLCIASASGKATTTNWAISNTRVPVLYAALLVTLGVGADNIGIVSPTRCS